MYSKEEHFILESTEIRGKREVKIGKFYCILNGKTYSTLGGLRNAVKPKMTMQEFYDRFYLSEDESKVCKCGKEVSFKNVLDGYGSMCWDCTKIPSPDRIQKVRDRFKGEAGKRKKELAINKAKETISSKSEDERLCIVDRRLETTYRNQGDDWFSRKAKSQWERRTDEDVVAMVNKANATKLRNGTMEYNFYAKANKKVVIEGVEYFCQGYEDVVLRLLSEMGINFTNGKSVPRIVTSANKSGIYRPDIFIPDYNLIIEVKSDFTLLCKFENNVQKQMDSIKQGYNHIFFAIQKCSPDRQLLEHDRRAFYDFLSMSISSQAQYFEKVQRLGGDSPYRAIAIGSGSAKAPTWSVI